MTKLIGNSDRRAFPPVKEKAKKIAKRSPIMAMTKSRDNKFEEVKCVIPDSSYASVYDAIVKNCQQKGQFDFTTTSHVSNVGLMAQKAEEYGSHDKTFKIASEGTLTLTDAAGNKIFEHAVQTGDIWRMCQVKDIPIQDWVKLAMSKAKATGAKAVFWLEPTRAHDTNLIPLVKKYLPNHDTPGCNIEFLKPADACTLACDGASEGLDTINCGGNLVRDYLTDLFSIHKLDTVCKRIESEKMELEPEDLLEQEDSIPQLDGAADPVTCNLCQQSFKGRNKGILLTSHKINAHFKDNFRRLVKDESRIDGFYRCTEENCTAKHKQKADIFKHLASVHNYIKKFSDEARTSSLSVPGPASGTEKISDLQTQLGLSHQQGHFGTGPGPGPQSLTATSSSVEHYGSAGTAETNQGIKLKLMEFYTFIYMLYLFRV